MTAGASGALAIDVCHCRQHSDVTFRVTIDDAKPNFSPAALECERTLCQTDRKTSLHDKHVNYQTFCLQSSILCVSICFLICLNEDVCTLLLSHSLRPAAQAL